LIRHGDLSLSAPLLSASGTMDNLLPSQVNNDPADKGHRLPVFTEEQRARLQKSRAERAESLHHVMESSASAEYASASEHALSNEQKQKELQDLQDGKVSEEWREEWRTKKLKAVQEERAANGGISEVPVRVPRNPRVSSLEELPPSFTAEKDVMDVQYCVKHISDLRSLVGKNDQLSNAKFSDFWAPDHKNTMPIKAVFTPEKLMHGKIEVLSKFYNSGLFKKDGEADSLNPPYFRISCELMGRVIYTFRSEYISDDENRRMSKEFEEHMKVALATLEATVGSTLTRLSEHHAASESGGAA
jgi:hypothetical protein